MIGARARCGAVATGGRATVAIGVVLAAWGLLAGTAAADSIAITGATVYTEPGKVINDATVIIAGDKVVAVGRGLAVPAGATVIDGRQKIVTAGLVDASSQLGLVEVLIEDSTREGSFAADPADPIHAAYRVTDGYNSASMLIPIARLGGITSAVPAPRGGVISGTSAWVSLAAGALSTAVVRAPLAMYATLGIDSLGDVRGSRGVAVLRLREVLSDARAYRRNPRGYNRDQARQSTAGPLDLEALLPVLNRQIPLVVRAHRSADIATALDLAREYGIRVVIEGGAEAWRIADRLARDGVGVILNPAQNLPDDFDQIHVRDDGAQILARAGVPVAIAVLRDPGSARTLRQLAGIAVARGMSRDHALAAITTVPAALFGVQRGRIARGQAADLVVWSGDPFALSTRAEHVIIGGVAQPMRSRQTELFERYRALPSRAPSPTP